MSRRFVRVVALAGLALAMTAVGSQWFTGTLSRPHARTATAFEIAARSDMESVVQAIGSVEPYRLVPIGTSMTGILERIDVEVGSKVEAGQVLAWIDGDLQRAKVAAIEARRRSLAAMVEARRAAFDIASTRAAQHQQLAASGAVSQSVFDAQRASAEQARAAMFEAEGLVQQAEAEWALEKARLDLMQIRTPSAGTVVEVSGEVGQTLVGSQIAPTLMIIADLARMRITVQISEADIGRVRAGTRARLSFIALPGRTFEGVVDRILHLPQTVNGVNLYRAQIVLDNDQGLLLPRMSVQAELIVEEARDRLVVPRSAIRTEGGQNFVDVVLADGELQRRRVATGLRTRTHVEIREGLVTGDKVAVAAAAAPPR